MIIQLLDLNKYISTVFMLLQRTENLIEGFDIINGSIQLKILDANIIILLAIGSKLKLENIYKTVSQNLNLFPNSFILIGFINEGDMIILSIKVDYIYYSVRTKYSQMIIKNSEFNNKEFYCMRKH
jgi:hypothetical protein